MFYININIYNFTQINMGNNPSEFNRTVKLPKCHFRQYDENTLSINSFSTYVLSV